MKTFSLKQLGVSLGYERIQKLGDRLEPISNLIEWDKFRKFFDENSKVGRPPYDPILMLKMLVLQSWYGISDEELEYQVADRFSFQKFLGFPNVIPDYSTVWRFREALAEEDLTDEIWEELQIQIEEKDLEVKKGVIQDAAFITADPVNRKKVLSQEEGKQKPQEVKMEHGPRKERNLSLDLRSISRSKEEARSLKK